MPPLRTESASPTMSGILWSSATWMTSRAGRRPRVVRGYVDGGAAGQGGGGLLHLGGVGDGGLGEVVIPIFRQ